MSFRLDYIFGLILGMFLQPFTVIFITIPVSLAFYFYKKINYEYVRLCFRINNALTLENILTKK